ncbi:MAG: nucleotidyltransferase domain-containing protein, partial [Verrucomicrobiota bacterium]
MGQILERIALLLEVKGENPFKVRAYRNGAEVVTSAGEDILALAKENELGTVKGIGDALAKKLHELATTGKMTFWENLRAEFPESLFELFDIPGLGPKKIKALYDAFGVDSVASLKEICESGKASELSGFGAKSVEKILQGIAYRESFAGRFRLGDVAWQAEAILEELRMHPATNRAETAGSVRRGKETVHDLDFLVASKEPATIMKYFVGLPLVKEVLVQGDTKASIRLENGVQCDLRVVSNKEFPFALAYFTGSKEHNVAMRSRALKRGLTLNEYRFSPTEGSDAVVPEVDTEEEIYDALGLDYVPPALRENT